jgi:predicted DNA-binding transcriptional regulator AlpA
MPDSAWWAQSDQIDASLRETKAMIARWEGKPNLGELIGIAIRDLRAAVASLEERVAKFEEGFVRSEEPSLITTAQLAEYLSMSAQTVKEWRSKDKGPSWVKVEGSVRYRRSDVESWLGEQL